MTECAEQGVAWVPFCPLGSAFDRLPNVTDNPVVIAVCPTLGYDLDAIASFAAGNDRPDRARRHHPS